MNKRAWLIFLGSVAGGISAFLLAKAYQRARKTCPPFRKQVYHSARELLDDLTSFWQEPAKLRSLQSNPSLTLSLATKLLLTVTGAYGCRSCGRLFSRYAQEQGLEEKQVVSLLRGEVEFATVDEAPALFFARHYVEHGGHPDPDLVAQLVERYGARTAQDIITYLRLLSVANRVGNTFDALLSRILGKPSPETTLWGELSVLLVFFFGILPLVPVWGVRVKRASFRPI